MRRSLRPILRRGMVAAVALALSLGALSLGGGHVPTAHADSSPTITATETPNEMIQVTGSGFGAGDSVVVEVYDSNYQLTNYTFTTSSSFCLWWHGVRMCGGGAINVLLNVNDGCWRTIHVIAYDYGLAVWSNWADVYFQCTT